MKGKFLVSPSPGAIQRSVRRRETRASPVCTLFIVEHRSSQVGLAVIEIYIILHSGQRPTRIRALDGRCRERPSVSRLSTSGATFTRCDAAFYEKVQRGEATRSALANIVAQHGSAEEEDVGELAW